ncbi:MAG: ubiquinol-cytochrome c reductase iron-sulfur subunit [Candidatus Midichloria sp.]|nr:ubiquinol-cytochrome c reductase iron-sulfur subunit [Candidatus Midichloria sp.]
MTDTKDNDTDIESEDTVPTRRDFVVLAASAVAGVGAITAAVPFIRSLSPDAGVLAVGSTEVDLSNIKEGETITVMWRDKPIFVTKRTHNQIEEVRSVNLAELRDPQSDEERVKKGKEQWLVTIRVCTHLVCVPVSGKGNYNGWFCPLPWLTLRFFWKDLGKAQHQQICLYHLMNF